MAKFNTILIAATLATAPHLSAAQDTESPVSEESVIEAIIVEKAFEIILKNIEGSERESGEIDKLIKALSGISMRDIDRYGICGGPNSEVRKLVSDLCNDIN